MMPFFIVIILRFNIQKQSNTILTIIYAYLSVSFGMGRLMNLKFAESISELKKRQSSIKAERRVLCLILLKSNKFSKQALQLPHLGRHWRILWLQSNRVDDLPIYKSLL